MSTNTTRDITMLPAHRGIGSNGSDEAVRPPPKSEEGVRKAVHALIETKLTPELLAALQDPKKLDVLVFELGKGFDNVAKWFVKK